MSDDEGFLTPQRIVFVSVCIVALGLGFQLAKFLILEPARLKQQRAAEHVADLDIPDTRVSKLTVEEREKRIALDKQVVEQLQKAGDKLEKPRNIDHWIYFPKDKTPDAFVVWAKKDGYAVEGPTPTDKGELKVKLSHTGVPKLEEISKHTLKLKETAKEYGGDYDGWETVVVKE